MWWFFVPVCETTTIEASAARGAPAMKKAAAMPIIDAKDDWAGELQVMPLRLVVTTEWRRDHGEPLSHRRDQLVFP